MLKNLNLDIKADSKVIHLKSIKDKSLGMIRFKNSILFLKTRFGIHSFFLKTPFDIIVLDKDKKIVKIKENFLPNRLFFWNPKYFLILELPDGLVRKLKLKVGHIVEFNL